MNTYHAFNTSGQIFPTEDGIPVDERAGAICVSDSPSEVIVYKSEWKSLLGRLYAHSGVRFDSPVYQNYPRKRLGNVFELMHAFTSQLIFSEHGFDDYDIEGHPLGVYRACVPKDILPNERFNVRYGDGSKGAAIWQGELVKSLGIQECRSFMPSVPVELKSVPDGEATVFHIPAMLVDLYGARPAYELVTGCCGDGVACQSPKN